MGLNYTGGLLGGAKPCRPPGGVLPQEGHPPGLPVASSLLTEGQPTEESLYSFLICLLVLPHQLTPLDWKRVL